MLIQDTFSARRVIAPFTTTVQIIYSPVTIIMTAKKVKRTHLIGKNH
jgi:hypothetical protein